MCAGRRDLEGTPTALLTTHVGEVGNCRRVENGRRQRLEPGRLDLAAEVRDDLPEMLDRDRLDTRERDLAGGLGGAHDAAQPGAPRALRNRERSGDRANATVESELADRRVLREPLGRNLPRRSQHGERDREVEPRALLPQRGRREVDRYPPLQRPLERRGEDAAANAMLRLLAGAVGEADDREAREPRSGRAPPPRPFAARGRRARG